MYTPSLNKHKYYRRSLHFALIPFTSPWQQPFHQASQGSLVLALLVIIVYRSCQSPQITMTLIHMHAPIITCSGPLAAGSGSARASLCSLL